MDRTAHHTPAPPRRLRMVDLMVLVAIAALAVPVYHGCHRYIDYMTSLPGNITNTPGLLGWDSRWWMPISLHTGWTLIFVATAVVACSLVPPRPPWRRLRRRPGFLVAATLVTFASFASVYTLLPLLLRRGPWGDAFLGGFLYGVPTMAGIAVTATLVTLLLLGRVRPAPGWPDRLGVAVGWASAGFLAFSYTRELLLYVLMSR